MKLSLIPMKLINYFKNKLVLSLLFILVLWLLWNRFFNVKLPHKIPHEFSSLLFIILFISCCFNIYSIFKRFIKKQTNNFFKPVFDVLIEQDRYVKSLSFIEQLHQNYFIKIYKRINLNINFYILMVVLPKIILLTIFILEIFYFHYINYFYKLLWLTLLALIYKYLLYSFKEYLDNNYTVIDYRAEIYHITLEGPILFTVKNFINYLMTNNIPYSANAYEVVIQTKFLIEHRSLLHLPNNVGIDIPKFNRNIKGAVRLCYFLQKFVLKENKLESKFVYFNIFMSIIYTLCTIYLLYINYSLIDFSNEMLILNNLLKCFVYVEEPFSGLFLPNSLCKSICF